MLNEIYNLRFAIQYSQLKYILEAYNYNQVLLAKIIMYEIFTGNLISGLFTLLGCSIRISLIYLYKKYKKLEQIKETIRCVNKETF